MDFGTSGWVIRNSKAYMASNVIRTWSKARACCQKKHQECDLASIANSAQFDFIKTRILSTDSIWIGGEKNEDSSVWSWTDGTDWNFANWSTGEPDITIRSAAAVYLASDGSWFDSETESSEYKFVCQCSTKWKYFEHTNKYYRANFLDNTWHAARSMCGNECANGSIASVPDDTTMDFLKTNVADRAWLGGEKKSGVWSWRDGSDWNYTEWTEEYANSGASSGVALRLLHGKWEMMDKMNKEDFICQCPKTFSP